MMFLGGKRTQRLTYELKLGNDTIASPLIVIALLTTNFAVKTELHWFYNCKILKLRICSNI
jgi:hypothetical protein